MAYQFPTSSSATHGVASTSPGIVLGVSQHDLLELVDKMPPPDFTNAVDSINEVNAWLKKLFWRRDIELLSPSPSVSDGEEPPLGPKTITQVPWTGRDLHQAQYLDLFDLFHERMGMPVVSASIVSSDIEFCLEAYKVKTDAPHAEDYSDYIICTIAVMLAALLGIFCR